MSDPLGGFILGPPDESGDLKRRAAIRVEHSCGNAVWVEPGKRARCHCCGAWVEVRGE